MRIDKFEDLEAWREARKLTNLVYDMTGGAVFGRDYRLRDQVTGAAISVMNNIAEGFTSQSDAEFIKFLSYARRSTAEVQTCLYVALDRQYVDEHVFSNGYDQAEKTRQIIDGLLRYLRRSRRSRQSVRGRGAKEIMVLTE